MIVDAHVHLFPDAVRRNRERYCRLDRSFTAIYGNPSARMASVEELCAALDKVEATGAVICGFGWEDLEIAKDHNDYIAETCRVAEGRFVGLGCVSPNLGEKGIQEVERCLNLGLGGIGEMAVYLNEDKGVGSPFFEDLAAVSKRGRRPLLLHATESVGHGYPGKDRTNLQNLYGWIQGHPDLDLVLAHWGGGLFFFELMPEVREACRRVYYDTAASPLLYSAMIYGIAVEILGSDRILLGSDYPLIHPERYVEEIRSQRLPQEAMDKILGGNAARLWRWEQGA
jgi:predicted TIM-barrel fold metal-dependent hydrolase